MPGRVVRNSRIETALTGGLVRWIDRVDRHPRAVIAVIAILTLGFSAYTIPNLGVNLDNVKLVAPHVRAHHDAFAALFPNLENALLVVIDAETPELARDSAEQLAERLRARTDRFADVYLPAGGRFFERNGLLYRTVDELDIFGDQMARIQPIIAELERDASIANLASLVRRGLDQVRSDGSAMEQWSVILDRVGRATVRVYDEFPLAVSWEEVLLRGSSIEIVTRRVIVVHPILDFESLLPAARALDAIRASARELELDLARGIEVRVTGNPALNHEEMIGVAWDIGGAGLFCFALVAFVLYLALRSLRLVAAAVITLLVGLVWTAAFAAGGVGHLNIISMCFAVLFIGLGVDFAIHLGMRYADLLRHDRSHPEALRGATQSVGSSLVLCTVTTAIGFFAFVPTDYLGVAELGLIAGAGVIIVLVLTLTLYPALLSSWLRIDPERHLRRELRFQTDFWRGFEQHHAAVRWVALAAFITALAVLPMTRFDPNPVALRDPDTESVQAFNDLLAQAGASSPWYVNSVADDLESAIERSRRMEALDTVENAITVADYIPENQREKLEVLADIAFLLDVPDAGPIERAPPAIEEQVEALRQLHDVLDATGTDLDRSPLRGSMLDLREKLAVFLDRVEREGNAESALSALEQILLTTFPAQIERLRLAVEASEVGIEDLPPELVRRMVAADGRARIQVFPRATLMDTESLEEFIASVRTIDPGVVGVAVNLIRFGRAIKDSFRTALITALAAISILLLILWRNLFDTMLVLVPLVLSATLTVASVTLAGMAFNYANVVVIPLLLGIGVDSGIHLVHRSKNLIAEDEGLLGTTTARAVFYSALTTTVSFGSLAFSSHRGMASMGIVLSVGMFLTVVCNLIVLPALADLRRPRKDGLADA